MKITVRSIVLLLVLTVLAITLFSGTAFAASKPAVPTNLRWETDVIWREDPDGGGEWMYPGYLSWDDAANTGANYAISVYSKDGKLVYGTNLLMDGEDCTYFHFEGFCHENWSSGEYRFSIQAVDPDDSANISDAAYSGYWTYTKPINQHVSPSGFRFAGAHLVWDTVVENGGYRVAQYYSNTPDSVGNCISIVGSDEESSFLNLTKRFGEGYYSFQVRTLSRDITKVCHSDWSDYQTVHWTDQSLGDFDFDAVTGRILKCNLDQASITVPASIGSSTVSIIESTAFSQSTGLKTLTLPDTITEIRGSCFNRCKKITDVYFNGTLAQWDRVAIESFNSPLIDATIHFTGSSKKGTLTNAAKKKVAWTYSDSTQEIAVSGDVSDSHPVLVASYDTAGRFLGVTPLTAENDSAKLRSGTAEAAIFWVDESAAPMADHAELPVL